MDEWRFVLTVEAEKDLEKLHSLIRQRILKKLKWIRENFNQLSPTPLTDIWKGFFKLRIGDWRIIYRTDLLKKKVIIYIIDKRDKVYQRKIPQQNSK